ncbi:putative exopolygalacturonase B [Aspergillus parasiticus]|uniref:galacturonan 1,4-alpha-galacturonidase n=1 Tax=Aspergillus parasiticus TaxID=5067 RepID=A0A5N6DI57_ASPPA|nr:putative exopolygalacturonase B [Aspergillus parasiticus]
MKLLTALAVVSSLSTLSGTLGFKLPPRVHVPRSISEFRARHPYEAQHEARNVVTIRSSANDTDDISDEFVKGLHAANHGGTLHLLLNETYVIGKALDLTFLDNIHVRLDGEIAFTTDKSYWLANGFHHPFQNATTFWKWGGPNIKIYGKGTLNGNGESWWAYTTDTSLRPILFYAQNTTNLQIEGIHFKDSPCWNNLIVTSKNTSFKDVVVTASAQKSGVHPKNTDVLDSLNLDTLTMERIWSHVGDDCFSPKPNTSNIHVNDLYCVGGNGVSLGSIGQYSGVYDYIKNVPIENVWVMNSNYGALLKSWAGPDVGYGIIDNVTFRNVYSGGNQYLGSIDSCYYLVDSSECAKYPSQVNVTNIRFENFTGYNNGEEGNVVASLVCGASSVCENITFVDWNVKSACGGDPVYICDGITGDIGVPCVNSSDPIAVSAKKATCTVTDAVATATPWL